MTGSIDNFFAYARTTWSKAGYKLLPGERDRNDAEAGFVYPDGTAGALTLVEHACVPPWTTLTIILPPHRRTAIPPDSSTAITQLRATS